MKKILIAAGILLILILGYAGYNMVASGKIDALYEEQYKKLDDSSEIDETAKEVKELSQSNPDFFSGPGMSYQEINRTESAKTKIDDYIEQDVKAQEELIQKMDNATIGVLLPLNAKKEDILEMHRLTAQQELNELREFNQEKLDRYNWAVSVCNGEKTIDEILEGKGQEEQNNIIRVMLNSSENLCD